ncbi:MAG: response regulator transcription factor [Spartobacteria bacterium]
MKDNIESSRQIRVMLVDDHPVMRKALRSIIDAQPDLIVVADADGGQAALDLLERARPDVILMDGSMPDMTGIETTRRLKQLQPDVKVVGLTLYEQSSYLEEMAALGACGYVLKTGSPSKIVDAVRTAAAGGTYFDPSIPRRAAAEAVSTGSDGEELTVEELAVAKFLAAGRSNAEIASSLGSDLPAVRTLRAAAMKKLGLQSRAQLVRLAGERHWLVA